MVSKRLWSDKPPTLPGHYWMKDRLGIRVVVVRVYCDQLCISNWPIPSDAKWSGPLPEPEDPK